MRHECYFYATKTVEELIRKFKPEPDISEDFVFSINQLLSDFRDETNPYLATAIHRIAKKKLHQKDLFEKEKREANELLLGLYPVWKDIIEKSDNPFYTATKLAVVGNIIDYGARTVESDIISQIHALSAKELTIDKMEELYKKIQAAKSILYLGDNNGEIVFDKLFLETINHPNVTFVVRGKPVINDVTMEDAKHVGIDSLCRIISNGFDAPSTLLEYCSDEFIEEYEKADLIISKGQGNFEGLMDEKRENLFFMLIAKCNPMAELLGVKKGDLIVQNSIDSNR